MFEKFFIWLNPNYYSQYSPEDHHLLYLHNRHRYILAFVCNWLFLSSPIAICIVVSRISTSYIAFVFSALLSTIALVTFFLIKDKLVAILYPLIVTQRGKAITKSDFRKIKKVAPKIYKKIMSEGCHGFCYYYSFSILDCLKKGTIQFVAIKDFYRIGRPIENYYKIHVLYVNNGWCFDTYSQRQMPVEELYEIWEGVFIAEYGYNEIRRKSYDGFQIMTDKRLKRLCDENDCSYFVSFDWLF